MPKPSVSYVYSHECLNPQPHVAAKMCSLSRALSCVVRRCPDWDADVMLQIVHE